MAAAYVCFALSLAVPVAQLYMHDAGRCSAGDFLQPDEVTFAVLLRGYGALDPPDWVKIDATLTAMRTKYNLEPTASAWHNPMHPLAAVVLCKHCCLA